jgi:hypothetical protein
MAHLADRQPCARSGLWRCEKERKRVADLARGWPTPAKSPNRARSPPPPRASLFISLRVEAILLANAQDRRDKLIKVAAMRFRCIGAVAAVLLSATWLPTHSSG